MATLPSLFGGMMSPQEMQQQAVNERASQFSQLTPNQQLSQMAYKAGAGLGTGVAGAFGVDTTDPMIKQATQIRQLASQFDTTTAEGMAKFAQALQAINPQAAMQAAQQAQSMAKTQSEITKNLRERESADPLQKIIQGGKYTPTSVEKYQTTGKISDLVPVDPNEPTQITETAEGVVLVNKKSGEIVKRLGSAPERGNKVNVNVDAKGETAFIQELGKLDAKEVSNARLLRESAIGELGSLQKMQDLNQQQLMSGSFATGRVGALNLLNTLGMASGKDKEMLSGSEQFNKIAGDLLLSKIKALGTNPSNTDREFIAKIVPQLENSPAARQNLINYLVEKANKVVTETTRLDTYARDNRGLKGYIPSIPLVSSSTTTTSQYSNLSDSELEARIKAAQAKSK